MIALVSVGLILQVTGCKKKEILPGDQVQKGTSKTTGERAKVNGLLFGLNSSTPDTGSWDFYVVFYQNRKYMYQSKPLARITKSDVEVTQWFYFRPNTPLILENIHSYADHDTFCKFMVFRRNSGSNDSTVVDALPLLGNDLNDVQPNTPSVTLYYGKTGIISITPL